MRAVSLRCRCTQSRWKTQLGQAWRSPLRTCTESSQRHRCSGLLIVERAHRLPVFLTEKPVVWLSAFALQHTCNRRLQAPLPVRRLWEPKQPQVTSQACADMKLARLRPQAPGVLRTHCGRDQSSVVSRGGQRGIRAKATQAPAKTSKAGASLGPWREIEAAIGANPCTMPHTLACRRCVSPPDCAAAYS